MADIEATFDPIELNLNLFPKSTNGYDSLSAALMVFTPGAVGGTCNVLIGQPIDMVKVRMQTMPPPPSSSIWRPSVPKMGTFGTLRSVLASDGIAGLYRGVGPPLVAAAPIFAITFASFDLAKNAILQGQDRFLTPLESTFAGGFTGLAMLIIRAPTERVKCLMQVQSTSSATGIERTFYKSSMDCVRKLYGEGGMRNLYYGSLATAIRDVPGNMAYFGTYELLRRKISTWEQIYYRKWDTVDENYFSITATMLAGGFAGVANWIVALPFDTLKSRLQTSRFGQYTGVGHVYRELMIREGPKALFRGLAPALIRAFPANTATFLGVEATRHFLFQTQ
uniref:Mitochondrial carrier protein n=1 Tax=Attheya septentrionalis TaxID=420275 RepID=A0A7S2XPF0_9STRA|mmetsp:Transcript_24466/g.44256  ORF Transcript_24466/g.44256 Transcript_24466/m.44256 type:complete len:337 (+) Transcript_24466:133-1143(+)|eukprot:CAMPEP_0198298266 /NCGR_PEP_ID=MMETSP1449-20131203/40292_1 /TAXON_ID=420275 /ORGANISM="Attheya septentrionalis, Strain CCMP2084" /LENGTH=336 /DNA_ID=CAMNT_0043999491 /DNA_START=98 /DNA_END=1108 /DNA_ORIENTATION=+